ncbi:potassium channel family protein [Streptomyces sp. Da 82-17]|uniref:potassium channel family protein n=1 Tax=Streptomyces sp. Da 82-17 TaxID=3377116 RepID=UPI0038D48EF2
MSDEQATTAHARRRARRLLGFVLAIAALVACYFLLPLDGLGPGRPGLSWTLFVLALALIAAVILREIRDLLLDKPDTRSGLVIAVLMVLSILVFASAYYGLAHHPGEFTGLRTRVDALYFTLVSVATVGYGDIAPIGQTARVVALLQIVYTLVFLTTAATALSRRVRLVTEKHHGPGHGHSDAHGHGHAHRRGRGRERGERRRKGGG